MAYDDLTDDQLLAEILDRQNKVENLMQQGMARTKELRARRASNSPTPTPVPAPTPSPAPAKPIGGGWDRADESFVDGRKIVEASAFGVKGDGIADDTAALIKMFASESVGAAFKLPRGNVKTTNSLMIYGKQNCQIYGAGQQGTFVRAANPDASTWKIEKWTGGRVSDFAISVAGRQRNNSNNNRRALMLFSSTDILVHNTLLEGCEDAALFIEAGCKRIIATYCTVKDNFSDNIHITGSCDDVLIQHCKTLGGGDDSYASIGYGGQRNTNIRFLDNESHDSGSAAISFEGTVGGVALRNKAYRSRWAAMRIDTPSGRDDAYKISLVDQILAEDNLFEDCVTDLSKNHPVILLWADYSPVHGVELNRNRIVNPQCAQGIRASGKSAAIDVIAAIRDTVMTGDNLKTAIAIGANASVTRSGNTMNGLAA